MLLEARVGGDGLALLLCLKKQATAAEVCTHGLIDKLGFLRLHGYMVTSTHTPFVAYN